MNEEAQNLNGKTKQERLSKIKDYLTLFQWIDKFLDSQFQVTDISTVDFSKIDVSIKEDMEEKDR